MDREIDHTERRRGIDEALARPRPPSSLWASSSLGHRADPPVAEALVGPHGRRGPGPGRRALSATGIVVPRNRAGPVEPGRCPPHARPQEGRLRSERRRCDRRTGRQRVGPRGREAGPGPGAQGQSAGAVEAGAREHALRAQRAGRDQELQLESARLEHVRNKQLFEKGLTSSEDLRRSEVAERQAGIELQRLEASRRNAQESTKPNSPASRSSWRRCRRHQEARRVLGLATPRPTAKGVVTWTLTEEGATVRKGDIVARSRTSAPSASTPRCPTPTRAASASGLPVQVRVDDRDARRPSDRRPADGAERRHHRARRARRTAPTRRCAPTSASRSSSSPTIGIAPCACARARQPAVKASSRCSWCAATAPSARACGSASPASTTSRSSTGLVGRRRGRRLRHGRLPAPHVHSSPLRIPDHEHDDSLEGVEKVYRTDRIETVALSDINLRGAGRASSSR